MIDAPWLLVYLLAAADWPKLFSPLAYVGPGPGIALVGSLLAVALAALAALVLIVAWPVRWLWRGRRARRAQARALVPRVVILGLDGLDPRLLERFLAEGLLPNFARLKAAGTAAELATTWPPLSPVAWSSFSTGTNPGKHNIFDFVTRNPADYSLELSSARVLPPPRVVKLGRFQLPLGRGSVETLRRSKPFWHVLGEAGVFSAVLRVPITFPPEKFRGVQLAAMGVPDLLGTQSTFFHLREAAADMLEITKGSSLDDAAEHGAGETISLRRVGNVLHGELTGPLNPLRNDGRRCVLPVKIELRPADEAVVTIGKSCVTLRTGAWSPWVRIAFPLAAGFKLRGICRLLLRSREPLSLYCTPLQVDPLRPALPISHPPAYANYLARRGGPFATLGLAEDTGALAAGVLNEEAFLRQVYDIHYEREAMFFDALDRVRHGLVCCVFDAPDRVQHMFWGREATVVRDLYQRMDELVGRTLAAAGDDAAVLVMSDHGFRPFERGVDLNAWLREHGYLHVLPSRDGQPGATIDWPRTQAAAVGMSGISLNLAGREAQGIVSPGSDRAALVTKLCQELTGLADPARGTIAIREAVPREAVCRGPYLAAAPDILIGYEAGYRVAWGAAAGRCGEAVFSDNHRAWCGDHCVHPDLVPGVLLANRPLRDGPRIIDLAPTVLELLGVEIPAYMDGESLCGGATSSK